MQFRWSCLMCCLVLSAPFASGADDVRTIELPSFGVASAPIPDGWRRVREPDEAIAFRLEFGDGKANEPAGVIDLQVYPKRSASNLKQLAQKEAKRFGGKLSPEAFELGGAEAFEFVVPPKSSGNDGDTALHARFIKNGSNYLALYERAATERTAAAYGEIANDIKIAPPAPPSESLHDRSSDPIELPAVKLVMDLPDPFRVGSEDGKRQEFRIINFATEQTEAEMVVTPISTFNEKFDAFLPTLGKSLARQYGWKQAPGWRRVAGKTGVAYTELMPAGEDSRGKPTSPVQVIVVSANNAAQLITIQYPGPADTPAKYAARCEQIAKSIRAGSAPARR